jgi:hypothetical protein
VCEPPWTVLDAGELQRKLQLGLDAYLPRSPWPSRSAVTGARSGCPP